ncbi:MAG: hypothetical protein LLG37_08845 [Spirochaetia bacterium]|nr:hypothetical protein [Spirochaetia bacterium]
MVINRTAVRLLSGKSSIKMSEALSGAKGSFSGRAIARMAGINNQACNAGFKRFVSERIVSVSGAGRSVLYSLNRKNAVVKEIIAPLFAARTRIPELPAEDVGKCRLKDVASIVLLGSVAMSE